MEDRDLVRQALDGDVRAYRRLIERYRNAVYGLAVSFVGDFDLAEDMAQEAFILGYYRLSTLADWDRFGVWLRTITANLCRMELRRRRAIPLERGDYDLDGMAGPGLAPDEVYERDEVQRQMLAALAGLSEKDREAVILYYLDERTVEEVGQFLGVSGVAVKGRLHRARQHLRKEMMSMVREALSHRRLGPEFADRVEVRTFGDLARLTDGELRTLIHHMRQAKPAGSMALIYGLQSDDSDAVALKARILEVLPEMERELFKVNLKYCDPVQGYQGEVLAAARRLQKEGAIRPAPKRPQSKSKGRIEMNRFADVAGLTNEEMQRVLREVDTKEQAVAIKSDEPGIEEVKARCCENVSERVRQLLETFQTYTEVTEEQVKGCQEGILKIVHRLQEAGNIRKS